MNFKEKLNTLFKSNEFKASLWSVLISFVIAIPFMIIFVISLLQNSYITYGFWVAVLFISIVFVLILSFGNVVYKKILNNYNESKSTKKEYLDIFVKELLGPYSLGIVIAVLCVVLDQFSKISAVKNLTYGESVVFIKNILNWTLAYNKGAAWSMCSEHTDILAFVSLFASFIILFFLKDFNITKKPIYSVAISFILGGTIGNMIDRFMSVDGVIDFIEFGFMDFPIFNVADTFLVVGTIGLMVSIIFNDFIIKEKTVEKSGELND